MTAAGLWILIASGTSAVLAQDSAPNAKAPEAAAPKPVPQIEDFAPPHEFVMVGDLKTHYLTAGDPTGRPIVFVHGFGSTTYSWRLNMPALAKAGYRVYALDVKGFGLTAKPRGSEYHLAVFTQHVLAFMDALRIDKPILVGNSMGGAIITRLALLHPDRVAGVVLVDAATPAFDIKSAPSRLLRDEKGQVQQKAKPEAISSLKGKFGIALAKSLITPKMIEMGLKGAYYDPKFVTAEAIEVYYRPFTIDGAVEAFITMTTNEDRNEADIPAVKSLKSPVLIVWGRFEKVIPVSPADWFAKELPTAKKVILEKSGHMPHEEEADAFNTLLVEFAASLPTNPK